LTRKLLASARPEEFRAGVELAGSLRQSGAQSALSAAVERKERAWPDRAAALKALAAIDGVKYTPLAGRVLADAAEPVELREEAANLLARLNSTEAQVLLLAALPSAPARLQNVIAAGLAGSAAGAEKLLGAVVEGKASARLLQERTVRLKLEQAKVPDLAARVAKLTEGLPPADQKMEELLAKRRAGFLAAKTDPELGAKVFEQKCAICHQLGGKGTKVGPQLDGIGLRGLDRLLEDILDPSRNVDQAFRMTTLNLKDGQSVSGLLLREEGAVLVLADQQGKEVRVPKAKVEEKLVSPLSPMPANFADQIPEADFYHLLAFLLRQQVPPAKVGAGPAP
jgi:putative heme-binding domain-containing protein